MGQKRKYLKLGDSAKSSIVAMPLTALVLRLRRKVLLRAVRRDGLGCVQRCGTAKIGWLLKRKSTRVEVFRGCDVTAWARANGLGGMG